MTERTSDTELLILTQAIEAMTKGERSMRHDWALSAYRELAALREQVRWIPVTERRPDGNGMVLVATADSRYIEKCPAYHLRVLWNEVESGTEQSCFWAWWREIGPLPTGEAK